MEGEFLIGREVGTGKTPEIVDTADGANEIVVGHVCKSREVGIETS